jgi:tetratricopeptide (TPR) repeat protein
MPSWTGSPVTPGATNALGEVLDYRGDIDGAITPFRRALELEPDATEVSVRSADLIIYNLGNALKALGNEDACIRSQHEAIAHGPTLIDKETERETDAPAHRL